MKCVGYNHPNLVQPLVVELLGYHEFFDLPEPSIDDSFCETAILSFYNIAKLLLVLNAAANRPTIKSLLLPYTWRHYEYLRNSNPHLTPSLETYTVESDNNKSDQLIESLSLHTAKTISLAMQAIGVAKCELLKLTLKNLKRLCTFSQENKSKWTFLRLYCSTLLQFHQILTSYKDTLPSNVTNDDHLFVQKLRELLLDSFKLDILWNVGDKMAKFVYALRLRISVEFLKLNSIKYEILYDKTLSAMKKKCNEIVDFGENFNPGDPISIKDWADDFLSSTPKFNDVTKERTAIVIEPDRNNERILRFHADLIACIPFTCILRNFEESELENLRIRVTYPSRRTTLQRISASNCVKRISDDTHRLRGEAFIADNVWTDVSSVDIGLVYSLPNDYCNIWKNNSHYIDLTETVSCKVYPKARC
uniref:Integrator complex subunit 4/Protein SIEL C-terminal Ig-like domain-containing protein n=1 Tax=Romanomermis culicivorax TaxID=13658 RepID=A0A915LBQ6_ROMCU